MKNSNKFYNINHTVFISLPIEDLQTVIIDCVNSCLKNNTQESKPTTEQPEQLLTVQEAAQFLNLTVPTIYSKVSKGELPVMKRSKRLYFSNLELMEYLKKGVKITIKWRNAQDYDYNNKMKHLQKVLSFMNRIKGIEITLVMQVFGLIKKGQTIIASSKCF
jgi:excisionase family DNA binding protein